MPDDCRGKMVDAIVAEAQGAAEWTGRPALSPRVLAAMRRVPRHLFVPEYDLADAYLNRAMPIGFGQTISQPFIVALMTDLLELTPSDTVLEIGTGSGYQAAVLAELCAHVYSVESVPGLGQRAAKTLKSIGYHNVSVRIGDGRAGWPEAAPFDGIVITAAATDLPAAVFDQLKPEGCLVAPLGPFGGPQVLYRYRRTRTAAVSREAVLPVMFVPLVETPSSGT